MQPRITYGQLQRLLRELRFVDRPSKPRCKAFEHSSTGLLIVWTADRLSQPAREADVISTRIHLDRHGLLDAADFEKYFGTASPGKRRVAQLRSK